DAPEEHRQRAGEHHDEVAERERPHTVAAQREARHARASWRAGAGRRSRAAGRTRWRAAARPVAFPLELWLRIQTDATSVWNGRLPEMIVTEPISPIARANAIATPER